MNDKSSDRVVKRNGFGIREAGTPEGCFVFRSHVGAPGSDHRLVTTVESVEGRCSRAEPPKHRRHKPKKHIRSERMVFILRQKIDVALAQRRHTGVSSPRNLLRIDLGSLLPRAAFLAFVVVAVVPAWSIFLAWVLHIARC